MGKTSEEINKLTFDEKRELANNTFQIKVIDPTTRAKNRVTQKHGEEIEYSILEDFYDNGWEFELGTNDFNPGITRIREYFQIVNNDSHLFIYKDKCLNLCWEIQKYKYKELGENQVRQLNEPEKPLKKDDHSVDALRYMIMTRPVKPTPPEKPLTIIQEDIRKILKPNNIINDWDNDSLS